MTLPRPQLDRLRWAALVDEARARLPYTAPEWTDHNAHDPGITLIELLAWAAELASYRLDQVDETQLRAALRLLGLAPRAARAARSVVAFEPGPWQSVPAGTELCSADGALRFRTRSALARQSARLAWLGAERQGQVIALPLQDLSPFGEQPARGDALLIGFDRALGPSGAAVRLFVASAHPAQPRQAVQWSYFDGQRWQPLPGLRDGTRGLARSGPLRFAAPVDHHAGGVAGQTGTYFIRCRLLDDDIDIAPRLRGVRINAVLADEGASVPLQRLGRSLGHAGERFALPALPLRPGSLTLELRSTGGAVEVWTLRDDLSASGGLARHAMLDEARGEIRFGDGLQGRVPAAGAEVWAGWIRGGGAAGNVAAHTLVRGADAAWAVVQPWPAERGADAEPMAGLLARAGRDLAAARALVTLADHEQAALRVPGAPVARARAIAGLHPRWPCLPAEGCVTLVIVSPQVRSKPQPSAALVQAVRCALEPRRTLGTELHVTGPSWTRVGLRVRLQPHPGVPAAALRAAAEAALLAFMDPLGGGPDGGGWPFGHAVHRSEVLALLQGLAGVRAVEGLVLSADDGPDDFCGPVQPCPHGLVRPGRLDITIAQEGCP